VVVVRPESPVDGRAVRRLIEAAFRRALEADVVDALRASAPGHLSLVAERRDQIVGHIAFSPVTIATCPAPGNAVGLGPMAVGPQHQGQGIGTRLVQEGLGRCAALGYDLVVVLGHPGYYPRFGFRPARELGLWSEYAVPDEVFMAMMLGRVSPGGYGGLVAYHSGFSNRMTG
jgi:putative acetyltransferase